MFSFGQKFFCQLVQFSGNQELSEAIACLLLLIRRGLAIDIPSEPGSHKLTIQVDGRS